MSDDFKGATVFKSSQKSHSYSALTTAGSCLKKYEYQFIQNLKADAQESGDMHFGTAMHLGIQVELEGGDGVEAFDTYWDSEEQKDRRYTRFRWLDLKNQGHELLRKFKKSHADKFKIFKMEERVYSQIGKVRVEGTPDFVGEFEGVPSVVDFKTSAKQYDIKKLISNEQLPLYAYMVRKEWNYPVEQIVYFPLIKGTPTRIQTPMVLKLEEVVLNSTLANIEALATELDKRNTYPQNRSNCEYCDFFTNCFGGAK